MTQVFDQFLDFKSFEFAALDLAKPFTILIGKNGSGKSNAIEGVELLAQIARGRLLHEITDVGRGTVGFQVRGGLPACPRNNGRTFGLGLVLTADDEGHQVSVTYQVHIQPLPEPRIQSEWFEWNGRTLFHARPETADGSHLTVRYGSPEGSLEQTESLPADRSVLSRYELLANKLPQPTSAQNLVIGARRYLGGSFVFDPQPRLMRAYERIGSRVLSRDGANLSAVLYALHKGSEEDRLTLARILQRIRQLPEEPFEAFDFVVTGLNDVIFGIRETREEPLVDARLLSDGTLRCLAILTALETVQEGARVIVEEFDNGLHPSRVKLLSEAIADVCARRKLNVLVTTHNPATLDGLSREQLEGVVLCFWDRAKKASRLVPLLELPRADVLLERGHLGDLVTRRVLEQHLMPGFEESQKAKAQEWLDSLP
ncbi:AAA family ATPase [Vitiosangium sp. GDMCC 1.1324]|uniref:AAA family ATPase n=1 Tax=Vitiosangium sp. (strain GDMCC 1.1324) TaxID=2138576 RepID=UPI00130ECEB3|nr:ATP-binding protein [Vitiosangium sp. GDMCC 1.1324]